MDDMRAGVRDGSAVVVESMAAGASIARAMRADATGSASSAGDGVDGGDVAPRITMGQRGDGSESEFEAVRSVGRVEVVGVRVDQLAFKCAAVLDLDRVRREMEGCEWANVKECAGRNVGTRLVRELRAWSKPRKSEGGVFLRVRDLGMAMCEVYVQGNPSYVDGERAMGQVLRCLDLSIATAFVDSFHCAIDYRVPRDRVTVGSARRVTSPVGGRCWPQSQYVGAKRSGLEVCMYDKTGERHAKGADCPAGVVRFEVRQRIEPACELRMRDLGTWPYPAGDVSMSWVGVEPAFVRDWRWAAASAIAAMKGVDAACGYLKSIGMNASQREQFRECACPDVEPRPSEVWARQWAGVCDDLLERLSLDSSV